ncbi:MAG: ParB family chromosome partitioning protein [Bacteroidia bacterium]|jgi:ParB family chromosome partitioning protein
MAKRNSLGRGLGALLEDSRTDITSKEAVSETPVSTISGIPIDQIETNPFQPRTRFDQIALDELAASIRQLGIIQPITVRKLGYGKYQLISGERRFRASQLAGLTDIPAYIRIANDQAMLEMALVENIQRQELDAIEIAISYQRLMDECNITQDELSGRVGKQRSTISNYLRLLKLPPAIQKGLISNQLTMGHARAIINVEDPADQLALFKAIVSENLSVRKIEDRVRGVKKPTAKKVLPEELEQVRKNVGEQLGAVVNLKANKAGKGKLEVDFSSTEDLKRILSILDLWP